MILRKVSNYALLIYLVSILGSNTLSAQIFQLKSEVDSLSYLPKHTLVGDFNQDGCLDLVSSNISKDSAISFTFIFNNQDSNFDSIAFKSSKGTIKSLTRLDLDHDDDLDLYAISEDKNQISHALGIINQGDGKFRMESLGNYPSPITNEKFADLDNNGMRETIAMANGELLLFSDSGLDNAQKLIPAQISYISVTNYLISDFNNDSWIDIFITLKLVNGNIQSGILYNRDTLGFVFSPIQEFDIKPENVTRGDIDQNGFDDILIVGEDKSGLPVTGVLFNSNHTFEFVPLQISGIKPQLCFIADFNSDGQSDISFIDGDNKSTTTHYLMLLSSNQQNQVSIQQVDTLKLDSIGYIRNIGDWDMDGDLDLSFWNRHTGKLLFYDNSTPIVNQPAAPTTNPIIFRGQNEIVVVWEPTNDDHTPSEAITYDLSLYQHAANELLTNGFKSSSGDRLYPEYGYYGQHEVAFVKNPPTGDYTLVIQAIDNALYTGKKSSGGDCTINFTICDSDHEEIVYVCDDNPIALEFNEAIDTSAPAWYSVAQGFMSFHEILNYKLTGDSDVVYAGIPGSKSCDFKTFRIQRVNFAIPDLPADTLLCKDEQLSIALKGKYDSVFWENPALGIVGIGNSIEFTPGYALGDTLVYRIYENSCELIDTIVIKISDMNVLAQPKTSVINNGSSLQLNASGASFYSWSPAHNLDASDVSTPLASPQQSGKFVVVGTDEHGCQDSDTIYIEVINAAFAPNLFSPNQDGSNERFRLLNLANSNDFLLVIFDRNGKKMFETSDTKTARVNGWDGTSKGNPVPQGPYYWKVSGHYHNGKPIFVNGKRTGVINLLR